MWQMTRFMQLGTGRGLQATLQKRQRQRVVYFDEWIKVRALLSPLSRLPPAARAPTTTQQRGHRRAPDWVWRACVRP